MQNYFFCGIKHCGKTTHAKIFGKKMNLPVFDGDDLILELIDTSIRDYYRTNGKEAFMNCEYLSLKNLLETNSKSKVISLGGGICDNTKATLLLKVKGIIIYIKLNEKTLFNRIIKDGIPPFLEGNSKEIFHSLYLQRDAFYTNYANITIELEEALINEAAAQIDAEINNWIINNGT
ncbi:MAG: hypothetical protein JJE21_02030 [Spirochaetaceae bacterium]|nr:hypothetical protein [Spirochaetaceae bacterium]